MITAGDLDQANAIARCAGTFFNPVCDTCIVNVRDGRLLGGVIFTGFNGASIGIHSGSFDQRWLDRDMLWIAFAYPFEQLGVNKLIGQIPSDNRKALDFNRKLGFIEEARIEGVFRNADLIVMSMTRANCRWLKRGHRGK